MVIVFERKFLVSNPPIAGVKHTHIRQGFLSSDPKSVVRVRVCEGGKCYLTVQGAIEKNSKQEFSFYASFDDALQMLENICAKEQIAKTRYFIPYEGDDNMTWEVDIFEAENDGLITADLQPNSEDQELILPDWIVEEVSDQAQYNNANLVNHPFNQWILEGKEGDVNCTICNDHGYVLVEVGNTRTPCSCTVKK